jgi:hypothetical protein
VVVVEVDEAVLGGSAFFAVKKGVLATSIPSSWGCSLARFATSFVEVRIACSIARSASDAGADPGFRGGGGGTQLHSKAPPFPHPHPPWIDKEAGGSTLVSDSGKSLAPLESNPTARSVGFRAFDKLAASESFGLPCSWLALKSYEGRSRKTKKGSDLPDVVTV